MSFREGQAPAPTPRGGSLVNRLGRGARQIPLVEPFEDNAQTARAEVWHMMVYNAQPAEVALFASHQLGDDAPGGLREGDTLAIVRNAVEDVVVVPHHAH